MESTERPTEYILVTSDNVNIVYDVLGYGPTIIFIHGWAATRNFWSKVRRLEGYRTVTLDLRGHGDSDPAKDYSQERIIQDIKELVDQLGVQKLHIVGHSLGGVIATKFTVTYQELYTIESLILVATPPIFKMGTLKRFFTSFTMMFFPSLLRKSFTPKTLYKPKKELLEFIWRESAKGSVKAYIKYLKTFDDTSIVEDLEEIRTNKVAIIPSNDLIVPSSIQAEYYDSLCNETYVIKNAGHNVMLEQPEELTKIIKMVVTKENRTSP